MTNELKSDTLNVLYGKGGILMNLAQESYSTKEVAEILGLTERTVRNYCTQKKLSHYKIGTKIYILKTDLEKFITKLKVEGE